MRYTLSCDTHDGNDPIEADVELPCCPQRGMEVEFWDRGAEPLLGYTASSVLAVVERVVLCAYAPEHVVVAIRFDGYDLDLVRRVMRGAQLGDTP